VENTTVQDHSFQNHKKAASAVLWLKIYWQKYLVEPMISRILKFAFEKKINNTKKMIYFGILDSRIQGLYRIFFAQQQRAAKNNTGIQS
jgi:hypothetical protein